jgi:hypothetical protein
MGGQDVSGDGSDRVEVDYIWPATLRLPVRPPKIVYLDLNHWITLSKALAGHPDGESHAEALKQCVRAVEENGPSPVKWLTLSNAILAPHAI